VNWKSATLAAAVAGLLAGAADCSKDAPPTPQGAAGASSANMPTAAAKHACKGQNACKGQGGCKTDTHACKGQNACKGQGGCNMS
jgi:hypothetical protein